jgi:hypothetical protein
MTESNAPPSAETRALTAKERAEALFDEFRWKRDRLDVADVVPLIEAAEREARARAIGEAMDVLRAHLCDYGIDEAAMGEVPPPGRGERTMSGATKGCGHRPRSDGSDEVCLACEVDPLRARVAELEGRITSLAGALRDAEETLDCWAHDTVACARWNAGRDPATNKPTTDTPCNCNIRPALARARKALGGE